MMEWLADLSPTLKLGLALLSIVVLMRLRVPMGAALLAGAASLGPLFGMPAADLGRAALDGLTREHTFFLLMIVGGLLVFSATLNETGQIPRIIEAFRALVGDSRSTLIAFPALIGLLPMPGGAIFSAPMVEPAAKKANLSPARVTVANYWFRHIWEYWLPLYPGVILALALTRLPTGRFVILTLPMTFCSLAVGYVIILRSIRMGEEKKRDFSCGNVQRFAAELTPILIVVGVVILLEPLSRALATRLAPDSVFVKRLSIPVALVLATAWLFARRGLSWPMLGKVTMRRQVLAMLFLVLGLMVFQAVLEHCGAVEDLRTELIAQRVPLVVIISALPFLAALVTGITVGFVGASFPLVVALVSSLPETHHAPYYFLAYVMGYTGMMLSPVHLCLVITSQYFKARVLRVYFYLLPLGICSAGLGVLLFLFYKWLLLP